MYPGLETVSSYNSSRRFSNSPARCSADWHQDQEDIPEKEQYWWEDNLILTLLLVIEVIKVQFSSGNCHHLDKGPTRVGEESTLEDEHCNNCILCIKMCESGFLDTCIANWHGLRFPFLLTIFLNLHSGVFQIPCTFYEQFETLTLIIHNNYGNHLTSDFNIVFHSVLQQNSTI